MSTRQWKKIGNTAQRKATEYYDRDRKLISRLEKADGNNGNS